MKDFLTKLLSKQAFQKATELVQAQPTPTTPEEATTNHRKVVDGLYAFIEDLDDKVELIPFAGPILKAMLDSPAVDQQEYRFCEYVVESVYRALKYADALAQGGK